MRIEMHGATHVGCVRDTNEDRFAVDAALGLMLICDGMGGHAAGEVAAELAVRHVERQLAAHRERLRRLAQDRESVAEVVRVAEEAVQQASAAVHAHAARNPQLRGMGTTLTMLLLSGDCGVVVHVGDSRLYLIRGAQAQLVTHDHTVESELRRRGVVLDEEARQSRVARMLTRSVGESVSTQPDVYLLALRPDDLLVACSDGLSKYLSDAQELIALCRGTSLDAAPARLIDRAISRGGSDNVTVVVGCLQASPGETWGDGSRGEPARHIVVGFESPMPDVPASRLS